MIYKRKGSRYWWYKFNWRGETVQESTKQTNRRTAREMEAARRTALARGEVGLHQRKPPPTLKQFEGRFMEHVEVRSAEKPATIAFYREKMTRSLEFAPLARARLDHIDENLIDQYVTHRSKQVSASTVNRALATLRRLLRQAQEWRLIDRVPKIRLLPGERNREFVLSPEQEKLYLGAAPQPLHDIAILLLDTGLRIGEALVLTAADLRLDPLPGAKYGYVQVRKGKSKNARRNVPLKPRTVAMLRARLGGSPELDAVVFTWDGRRQSFQKNGAVERNAGDILSTSLNHLQQSVRDTLKLPSDFVLHSFRHTMLTRLGEAGVDAFTIMKIAGHSSITVSQKYIHPSPESVERAFEKLEQAESANPNGKQGVVTFFGTVPVLSETEGDGKPLSN